jgi:hypothetical protein
MPCCMPLYVTPPLTPPEMYSTPPPHNPLPPPPPPPAEHGHELAELELPDHPVQPLTITDFNFDGLSDIVAVTREGLYAWTQVRWEIGLGKWAGFSPYLCPCIGQVGEVPEPPPLFSHAMTPIPPRCGTPVHLPLSCTPAKYKRTPSLQAPGRGTLQCVGGRPHRDHGCGVCDAAGLHAAGRQAQGPQHGAHGLRGSARLHACTLAYYTIPCSSRVPLCILIFPLTSPSPLSPSHTCFERYLAFLPV